MHFEKIFSLFVTTVLLAGTSGNLSAIATPLRQSVSSRLREEVSKTRVAQDTHSESELCVLNDSELTQYLDQGLYIRLEQAYREILEDCAKSYQAYFGLGKALYLQGWHEQALEEFQESKRLNPNNSQTHKAIGDVYLSLKNDQKALNAYEEAIQIDEFYIEAYLGLGQAKFNLGDVDSAIKIYEDLLKLDSSFLEAYLQLGDIYQAQADFNNASMYYQAAIGIDDTYLEAYLRIAKLLVEQERIDEAIGYYQNAIQIHQDLGESTQNNTCNPDIYYALGDAYIAKAELIEAGDSFKLAAECLTSADDFRAFSAIINLSSNLELFQLSETFFETLFLNADISEANLNLTLSGGESILLIDNPDGEFRFNILNQDVLGTEYQFDLTNTLQNPLPDKSGFNYLKNPIISLERVDETTLQNVVDSYEKNDISSDKILSILNLGSLQLFKEKDANAALLSLEEAIKTQLEQLKSVGLETVLTDDLLGESFVRNIVSIHGLGTYLTLAGKRDEVLTLLDETINSLSEIVTPSNEVETDNSFDGYNLSVLEQELGFLAYVSLAYRVRALGRPQEAEEIIRHTHERYSESSYLLLARIFTEIDRNNYDEANRLIEIAKGLTPQPFIEDKYDQIYGGFYASFPVQYKYLLFWAENNSSSEEGVEFHDLVSFDELLLDPLLSVVYGEALFDLFYLPQFLEDEKAINSFPHFISEGVLKPELAEWGQSYFLRTFGQAFQQIQSEDYENFQDSFIRESEIQGWLQNIFSSVLAFFVANNLQDGQLSPQLLEAIDILDLSSSTQLALNIFTNPNIQADTSVIGEIRKLADLMDQNIKRVRERGVVLINFIQSEVEKSYSEGDLTRQEANLALEILDGSVVYFDVEGNNSNLEGSTFNRDIISKLLTLIDRRVERAIFTKPPYLENIPDTSNTQIKRSVVAVLGGNELASENIIGAGTVIARNDNEIYVLVAKHTLRRHETIRVEFFSEPDTAQKPLRLYAERIDTTEYGQGSDLALLKVVGGVPDDITPIALSPHQVSANSSVSVVGHPGGLRWIVVGGTVTSLEENVIKADLSDFGVGSKLEGFSGGPTLNENNEFVGLFTNADDLGSAISAQEIQEFIDQWLSIN